MVRVRRMIAGTPSRIALRPFNAQCVLIDPANANEPTCFLSIAMRSEPSGDPLASATTIVGSDMLHARFLRESIRICFPAAWCSEHGLAPNPGVIRPLGTYRARNSAIRVMAEMLFETGSSRALRASAAVALVFAVLKAEKELSNAARG